MHADSHSEDLEPLTAGYVRSSSMNEPGQRPSSRDSPGRVSRDPRPARMRSNRVRTGLFSLESPALDPCHLNLSLDL